MDTDKNSLNLREGKNNIYIQGITRKKAENEHSVIEDLLLANQQRQSNETSMNKRSSRSHFIVSFEIETKFLIDYDEEKSKNLS